ncbi:MAG: polysaccharide deacetylase family protein [Chloroflexi bacterium]|nr:polysaccharide deacetylase family protein [Chloroflexota bacterium]
MPSDYVGYALVPRFFPETGHNVDGEFLAYVRHNGGAGEFGYPVTEEFWEPSGASAAGRMVQYFQRARLECDLVTKRVTRSPLGELLVRPQPAVSPAPEARFFTETGHNVMNAFLRHFETAGGVEVLGYPISEEVEENEHVVQWFEYVRLEWWPEHPPAHRVQLGLLGDEHLRRTAQQVPAAAVRRAAPLEPVREWILPPPQPPPARPQPPLLVPILYYHHVPSQQPLRTQIRAFKRAGRTIVPLGRVVDAVRGEATLPPDPLVLTFDDAWESQFQNAAPVLQAEDVPATFFVITRYLSALAGYMTWDQARMLKERGHEVESHSHNHPRLDTLYAADEGAAVAEIWESLAVLESRLGRSRRLFAYPDGRWDDAVVSIVARIYRGAVATGGGALQTQDLMYALRRIKAEPSYAAASLLKQMV